MAITTHQYTRHDDPGHPGLPGSASGLASRRVAEAMSSGLITCDPSTSLRVVAGIMAEARIHCVVVDGIDAAGGAGWGIVSDLDLVAASAAGDADRTAAEAAVTEVITVDAQETLERAAQVMAEHELTHLIVAETATGRPVGVVSTLDLAAALSGAAGGPRRTAQEPW